MLYIKERKREKREKKERKKITKELIIDIEILNFYINMSESALIREYLNPIGIRTRF